MLPENKTKLFNPKTTIFLENNQQIISWRESLKMIANLMVEQNIISENWIKDLNQQIEKFGFYFIITDLLALPHTSPSANTLKLGTAFIVLAKPIIFEKNGNQKEVKYLLALSSTNPDEHFFLLEKIVQFWEDENFLYLLEQIKNQHDLKKLFQYELEKETGKNKND